MKRFWSASISWVIEGLPAGYWFCWHPRCKQPSCCPTDSFKVL